MENFFKIYNNFEYSEKKYENLLLFLNDKNTIDNYNYFLKEILKEDLEIKKIKIFLSYYMLLYVPDVIINIENNESNEIKTCVKELLNKFDNLVRIYKNLKNYNNLDDSIVEKINIFKIDFYDILIKFEKWQKSDLDAFIFNSVSIIYDLKLTLLYINNNGNDKIKSEDNDIIKTSIEKQIINIISNIKSLNLESKFIKIYNEYLINQKKSSIKNEIIDIGKNAFYDCLEHKINNKEFESLEIFLNDFKKSLSRILPKNEEFNKMINFEESFDIKLIIQMIKYDAFDNSDFLKLFNYFFDIFQKLQPKEDDDNHNIWKNNYLNNFNEKEFVKNVLIFLRYYMDKIETIDQKIKDFYNIIKNI